MANEITRAQVYGGRMERGLRCKQVALFMKQVMYKRLKLEEKENYL